MKISKKDTGNKENKRETDTKIKKLREEWRLFLILCGIKSKPEFEKVSFYYLPSEFEQKDQERFVIWENGINKAYTSNNPVDITVIDLDEPTKTIISNHSGKSTQFSDLLFTIWKEQFGELIQQKTRVGVEEIVPCEFFTKFTRRTEQRKILPDYLWAGIAREKIPLTTIDNRAASSQSARRVTGSGKELLITSKYIDLVSETDHYDDFHEMYYNSLNVEKLSTADINELWNKVDKKNYGDIISAAIECAKADLISGDSLKFSLELYDNVEDHIRPATDFYLGKQAPDGKPLIEKQYGDAGRELGKLLNLPSDYDAPVGIFDNIFERGLGVKTLNRDERLYGLMNSWSKWNETSKQLIKDDFERSLKDHNIALHPFIIFNDHDLAYELNDIEAIVINLELSVEEIPRLKKFAIDLGLILPEEYGELKPDAEPLDKSELREIEEICNALLEFESYNDEEKKFLSEKLQLIGGYENLGQKIRKTRCIQRVIKINKEFVIDIQLPFFEEKDQLFYIGKDLNMREIISELLQYFGFGLKRHNLKDTVDALAQIRKKPGSDKATEKGKIPPVPEHSPDRKPGDPLKGSTWRADCDVKFIRIRIESYNPPAIKDSPKPGNGDREEEPTPEVGLKDNLSTDEKNAIGEQGEKYAVRALLHMKKEKYPNAKVEEIISDDHYQLLINQKVVSDIHRLGHNQSGYDIKIIDGDVTEYIDVKSTKNESKDYFHITDTQWQFAQKKGDLFHIHRVYNAGTKSAKIVIITNPCELLDKKKINAKFDVRLYI
jgi:hypothetical protein